MTTMDLEAQQLKLEQYIVDISLDGLKELATHLKVDLEGDGRLKVLRSIRRKIEEIIDSSDNQSLVISDMLKFIENMKGAAETENEVTDVDAYAKAKDDLKQMQDELKKTIELQQKQIEEATAKLSSLKQPKDIAEKPVSNTIPNVESILRREFKIVGSIGGEKDKLSYVGLMRQIESGTAKGYKEAEIIEAVIRCINSSTKLKSYLEIMKDITLQKLCQILRVHYQEKSASELYKELTTLAQGPKESAQDFLLRALSLRERTLFASEAEEPGRRYERSLIKGTFVHGFETGLREEVIRNKIRNSLHDSTSTDEMIMAALNKIVMVEEETQAKLRASKAKENKVCAINATGSDNIPAKPAKVKDTQSSLMTTLTALQAQVTELNAKFEASRQGNAATSTTTNGNRPRQNRRKCKTCYANDIPQCNHCFKCGSADHFSRRCKSSGNGKMLHPRDRE